MNSFKHCIFTVLAFACLALQGGVALAGELPQGNLVKNASFEGSKRYWYESEELEVVGDAVHGQFAIKIGKDKRVQSAAFELVQGKPVTISFSAKGVDAPLTVGWQCTPCAREIGVKAGLTWGMKSKNPVKLTTEWQRFTFTFTPNVAQDGFWPRPTFMMQLGDGDKPWLLDAVTVAYSAGADKYVARREIEVATDCSDLKGYRVDSNLLAKGQSVTLTGSACNTGSAERAVTLRFAFIDYEGETVLGPITEKKVTIQPGKTVRETATMALPATGLVLARISAYDGDTLIDSSDLPLTSLPYEKAATKPDYRERFGGSYFGPHSLGQGQRIGFGWSRWYPHNKWETMQKEGPDKWNWLEKEMDQLQSHGISQHVTLYARPKWAFEKNSPLPKDMQWAASDPKWDDFSVQTYWDKFVAGVVERYKGRSVTYEIENEPEFDGWDKSKELKDQYVSFTIRTAKLIKKTDPKARVQIDNVYGIPSSINNHLLTNWKADKKLIDEISWHDYHDGWLADGPAITRMKLRLEELGFGHVEIWFNEGWSYTNTAQDEPALALTHHTSSANTNAMVCSVAELTVHGQKKTVLFHTAYETHGMSFWDYSGPGTMLWDYNGYALPLVGAWNTLAHHIGLSEEVGFVRPPGANFCVFQDLRNNRGVMVAYADRGAKTDVTVELPIADLSAEDIMGNPVPLKDRKLVLRKTGRPVYLYSPANTDGKSFLAKLTPLDRKNASFVSKDAEGAAEYRLPLAWEGTKRGSPDGNPVLVDGKPLWRLDQVWPDNPIYTNHYTPLLWNGTQWFPEKNHAGGQPAVTVGNGTFRASVRGSWGGAEGQRIAALCFIAPKSGVYRITAKASTKSWSGNAQMFKLGLFKKDTQRASPLKTYELPRNGDLIQIDETVELTAGHELVVLPLMPDWHHATNTTVEELIVREAK